MFRSQGCHQANLISLRIDDDRQSPRWRVPSTLSQVSSTGPHGLELVRYGAALLLAAAVLAGCATRHQSIEVSIAAAANLTDVFQELSPRFEKATGIHPVVSFASTAQLARQIENAAPYDLVAGADAQHIDELDRKGLLVPGTNAVYAIGVLAMWIPPGSRASVNTLDDLRAPSVRVIAIAKPDLAPYGTASIEALVKAGVWRAVQSKVVYAENISMAKQYGASNNADVVFTAYSLVRKEGGGVVPIDQNLHQPITQKLGVVARSQNIAAARRFADFLLNGEGREVLRRFGYQLPTATRTQ